MRARETAGWIVERVYRNKLVQRHAHNFKPVYSYRDTWRCNHAGRQGCTCAPVKRRAMVRALSWLIKRRALLMSLDQVEYTPARLAR